MGLSRRGWVVVRIGLLTGIAVWDVAAAGRSSGGTVAGGPFAPMTTTPSHTPTPTYTTTAHSHSPTPTRTPAPVIYGITPASGPPSGDTAATVVGDFFLPGATTTLGGVDVNGVVVDASQVDFSTPPLPPASLNDLTVTNPDGQFRTRAEAWFADFLDVPQANPFHADVERLFRQRATAGCGTGHFCPSTPVTRAQAAVFLVKGSAGYYVPPPCSSTVFGDVPCPGGINVDWINELHAYGVTAGCGDGNFCPLVLVTRAQMAVLLVKRTHVPGWAPPACGSTVFADVPCPGGPYVDWINELAAEGLTSGCGGGLFCPDSSVRRDQLASFLVRTFYSP